MKLRCLDAIDKFLFISNLGVNTMREGAFVFALTGEEVGVVCLDWCFGCDLVLSCGK